MRKPVPANLALKSAIFATGRHQQDIAKRAHIEPQKLSHVIYYRRYLTARERTRLAKVLGCAEITLWPDEIPSAPEPEEIAAPAPVDVPQPQIG